MITSGIGRRAAADPVTEGRIRQIVDIGKEEPLLLGKTWRLPDEISSERHLASVAVRNGVRRLCREHG